MEGTRIWYTREFMVSSMLNYLKDNGYRTQLEENILLTWKRGGREIIEIKGFHQSERSALRQQLIDAAQPEAFQNWFTKTLHSSLLSLVTQFKNDHLPVSLCLPDLARCREILEKVSVYFSDNNLHCNIYLVNEKGSVEVMNLNAEVKSPELIKKEA